MSSDSNKHYWYQHCPYCNAKVVLNTRKDFESFSNCELDDHINQKHPELANPLNFADMPPYCPTYTSETGRPIGERQVKCPTE
tara:strand:+ start:472 stop:720 length:249 start_codon:yes stop_codon:yes gene_type:complete